MAVDATAVVEGLRVGPDDVLVVHLTKETPETGAMFAEELAKVLGPQRVVVLTGPDMTVASVRKADAPGESIEAQEDADEGA